jgi:hypothetical protein
MAEMAPFLETIFRGLTQKCVAERRQKGNRSKPTTQLSIPVHKNRSKIFLGDSQFKFKLWKIRELLVLKSDVM